MPTPMQCVCGAVVVSIAFREPVVDQPLNNNENLKYHHQETKQGTMYPPFDTNDPQNQQSYQVLEHSSYWRPL